MNVNFIFDFRMGPSVPLYKIISPTNLPQTNRPSDENPIPGGLSSWVLAGVHSAVTWRFPSSSLWNSSSWPFPGKGSMPFTPSCKLTPRCRATWVSGSSWRWFWVRKTASLLTHHCGFLLNTHSSPLPASSRAPRPGVGVLFLVGMRKTKKASPCCLRFHLFTWRLSKREVLVRF